MSALETSTPVKEKENLNEVLLSWNSSSHPFKKRNKLFYQTVVAFTFLLVVIVFFLHEFMLIGVILSIAFVVYVISSVEPIEVTHKITPLGINNAGRLFRWNELYGFWFEEKYGLKIIVIQTRLPFPGQIRAVYPPEVREKLKAIADKYLLYFEKPQKSFVDKLSDWVSQKFPLETTA